MLSQHGAIYNATLAEFEKSEVKVIVGKAIVENLGKMLENLIVKKYAC